MFLWVSWPARLSLASQPNALSVHLHWHCSALQPTRFVCSSLMCHVRLPGWQRPPRCRPGRKDEPDTWRFHCHHKPVSIQISRSVLVHLFFSSIILWLDRHRHRDLSNNQIGGAPPQSLPPALARLWERTNSEFILQCQKHTLCSSISMMFAPWSCFAEIFLQIVSVENFRIRWQS